MENNLKGVKPIVRVAVYLRLSRASDGVQDLKRHKDYLIEVCNRNEWTYELFEEIESSQDITRPELQRMRQEIALGKFQAVMVHNVDRLSRRARHFIEIVEDYFLSQGLTSLYEKDTLYDLTDATTITMLQLKATLSQAEYSFIVSRLRAGKMSAVKEGKQQGKLVHGYYFDKNSREIKVNPDEAKVVRMMADMLLAGVNYREICGRLNSLGYRTRGGKLWGVYSIHSIMNSPVIRGHARMEFKAKYSGESEIIESMDSHEAIITEAEYVKIKQLMDNKAKNYKNISQAPTYWLQGLLRCPYCGKSMNVTATKKKRNKQPDGTILRTGDIYYSIRGCGNSTIKGAEKCPNLGCKVETVEESISMIVKAFEGNLNKLIDELMQLDAEDIVKDKKTDVNELKQAITKLENNEESLLDLLVDAVIDKLTYNNRINIIKEKKASLLKQLNDAETQLKSVNVEQEISHFEQLLDAVKQWDSLAGEKKRSLLQMLFKEMTYDRLDRSKPPIIKVIPY